MFWNSFAEMHAALNDLPPALFVAGITFEVLGHITKRQSLTAAGFWALIASAAGAGLAVWSGLGAEDIIEHGSVMHRSVERHQTLAIAFTVLASGMAAWRVWNRGPLTPVTFKYYLALGTLGLAGITWTAKVGGRIVFQHAGGIETRILESSLAERRAGHAHEAAAPAHEHPDEADGPAAPAAEEHEHDPDSTLAGQSGN